MLSCCQRSIRPEGPPQCRSPDCCLHSRTSRSKPQPGKLSHTVCFSFLSRASSKIGKSAQPSPSYSQYKRSVPVVHRVLHPFSFGPNLTLVLSSMQCGNCGKQSAPFTLIGYRHKTFWNINRPSSHPLRLRLLARLRSTSCPPQTKTKRAKKLGTLYLAQRPKKGCN